jgi:ATP-dependent exoDNAse (exonuclease V) beta subunit
VCFVARVNQRFNFRPAQSSEKIRFDKTAGIVAFCHDPESLCRFRTLHCDYAERINRKLTAEEEMRKLYVAATRAECKLIFTGFGEEPKSDSYAAWIFGNVAASGGADSEIEAANFGFEQLSLDDIHFADDESAQIAANINAVYPQAVLGTIPRKMTATQVGVARFIGNGNENEHDEPIVFPRNPSFRGEGRLTGKKRGDAYHKAMELIDFHGRDYYAQANRLKLKFTPLEWRAIDFVQIAGFFGSALGQRAVNSYKIVKEYKLYTEIELSEIVNCQLSIVNCEDRPFIQGIADMFFYEGDEIVLVDYKTNRNTTAERLVHDYRGQLLVYKKAIEEMTGSRVKECWLYSFELGAICAV